MEYILFASLTELFGVELFNMGEGLTSWYQWSFRPRKTDKMGKDLHKSANTQISNPTAASAARSNAQSLRSARSLKWGVVRNRARSVRDENFNSRT